MRRHVALMMMLAGSVFLATPGHAGPATPSPTVAVTMTTPAGTQPAHTVQAAWEVNRPGRAAALIIQGASTLPTTVLAVWTSAPLNFASHFTNIGIYVTWYANQAPYGSLSNQTVRIRFTNAHGAWGRWTTADQSLLTGGSPLLAYGRALDVYYAGSVPVRGVRVQMALTDTLNSATVIQQRLEITS